MLTRGPHFFVEQKIHPLAKNLLKIEKAVPLSETYSSLASTTLCEVMSESCETQRYAAALFHKRLQDRPELMIIQADVCRSFTGFFTGKVG